MFKINSNNIQALRKMVKHLQCNIYFWRHLFRKSWR